MSRRWWDSTWRRGLSRGQAGGRADRLDHRADIYSLGVTLYQLTTLRLPFEEKERSALLDRILHDEPVRPQRQNPAIPADLETIVRKAMAKEPSRRYDSAASLGADLQRYLDGWPVEAGPPELSYRVRRLVRRYRVQVIGVVATLLVAIIGAVAVAQGRTAADAALTAPKKPLTAEEAAE